MSSKSCENQCKFKSKIGGQALIEGVMMRGVDTSAMAVRLPSGEIDLETWEANNGKNAPWFKKVPFVRGVFNFVSSLTEGYKCLSKSADKAMADDEEPETKFEIWLTEKLGDKASTLVMGVALVIGVVLALFLFMWLPSVISGLIGKVIPMGNFAKTAVEGVIKIVVFISYLALTSLMKDMRRTYEYHGAEHKTIACYEAGMDLNVDNIKKMSRFHPRCGTSFIFIILFLSIIIFSCLRLPWDNTLLRVVCKLALMPFVIGIAYELIRVAGRYDNLFTKIISYPGIKLQKLTTREPDEKEIEVALAAFMPCIPKDKEDDVW